MQISKRNGTVEAYEAGKIKRAMGAAFASVGKVLDDEEADRLIARIERAMASAEQGEGGSVSVEDVQDLVERALMEANHYEELKSYILYREDRARKRAARERLCAQLPSVPALPGVLASVQKEFPGEEYELAHLSAKFQSFAKPDAADGQLLAMLVKAAVELTTQEAPSWTRRPASSTLAATTCSPTPACSFCSTATSSARIRARRWSRRRRCSSASRCTLPWRSAPTSAWGGCAAFTTCCPR